MVDATNISISIAGAGDNTIIAAPGAGLKIKITSLILVCNAAVTVTLKSGATSLSGAMSFTVNGGLGFGSDMFPIALGTNEAFIISLGGAVQVSGFAEYIIGS